MQVRRKPAVLSAEQFREASQPWPKGVEQNSDHESTPKFYIDTPDGRVAVADGDWIIYGVGGGYCHCAQETFDQIYEAATTTYRDELWEECREIYDKSDTRSLLLLGEYLAGNHEQFTAWLADAPYEFPDLVQRLAMVALQEIAADNQ